MGWVGVGRGTPVHGEVDLVARATGGVVDAHVCLGRACGAPLQQMVADDQVGARVAAALVSYRAACNPFHDAHTHTHTHARARARINMLLRREIRRSASQRG
jgi:hypothetical protein